VCLVAPNHVAPPGTTSSFKHPPSLPVRFAPRPRLNLTPVSAFAGSVGRIAALLTTPSIEAALLGYAQQR
jgi:hypothetical protein